MSAQICTRCVSPIVVRRVMSARSVCVVVMLETMKTTKNIDSILIPSTASELRRVRWLAVLMSSVLLLLSLLSFVASGYFFILGVVLFAAFGVTFLPVSSAVKRSADSALTDDQVEELLRLAEEHSEVADYLRKVRALGREVMLIDLWNASRWAGAAMVRQRSDRLNSLQFAEEDPK